MFDVSQLYSIPQFLRTNFYEVNYNELAVTTIKDKKRDIQLFDQVFYRILAKKNINIFNKS